jgi:hypothetical protein
VLALQVERCSLRLLRLAPPQGASGDLRAVSGGSGRRASQTTLAHLRVRSPRWIFFPPSTTHGSFRSGGHETLLCQGRHGPGLVWWGDVVLVRVGEGAVDGAGEVSLQTAERFPTAFAFGFFASKVRTRRRVRTAWVTAIRWRAQFSCRFPERLSRWRWRLPLEARIGATPACIASRARRRCRCSR